MKNMTDNPNTYYYRSQACIVYRQPAGKAFSEADLTIWTASCESAERLVEELERLRKENVELQKILSGFRRIND